MGDGGIKGSAQAFPAARSGLSRCEENPLHPASPLAASPGSPDFQGGAGAAAAGWEMRPSLGTREAPPASALPTHRPV